MRIKRSIKYIFVLLCLLYVASSYFVVEELVSYVSNEQQAEEKSDFVNKVSLVRAKVESAIYSGIYTANSLATLLTVDHELALSKFDLFAETLISKAKYIRNIGVAESYIMTHVYPYEDNEKAVGLDFRSVPKQLESVEQARTSQSVILAGPLTLVQGGQAVIARYPIFEDFPENKEYWGGVSVVINIDELFREEGIWELSQENTISIRGRNGSGPDGEVFFGEESAFDNPDALFSLEVPNGSWLIAGKLSNNVAVVDRYPLLLRVFGYSVSFLLLMSMIFLYRGYRFATETSYTDVLTGLPNRRFAMELLSKLISRGAKAKFTVITADLNRFKYINDTYGHDAGDYILKAVSDVLVSNIRASDYVFRLGGDEFLIVLPRTIDEGDVTAIIQKLKLAIEDHKYRYNDNDLSVTLSAGFSRYPADTTDLDEILSMSDYAMYGDKKSNKSKPTSSEAFQS